MFAPISAIFSLLFFASTLPNGIRLVELPSEGDSIEIVAGYTTGGLTGLISTAAGKSFLMDAYAAGAKITFINNPDRTAVQINAPKWALPMLTDRLAALFKEIPSEARNERKTTAKDFRSSVEDEIRSALLGSNPQTVNYATGDAFVLISAPAPGTLREALAAVPRRDPPNAEETVIRLPAERTLRFKADLDVGAVIFASPIPGAHYRQWYLMLLLDRLIHRVVPISLQTTLPLTVPPNYYRLELAVPSGQFPEPFEENLMQELQRLQFTRANARDLEAARQDALAYIASQPVQEWFASRDMLAERDEGTGWIQAMSADDMRAAARDLLIMNRVIATWPPKPRQTTVSQEPLSKDNPAPSPSSTGRGVPEGRGEGQPDTAVQVQQPFTPFPAHTHPAFTTSAPERLASGVSIVASTSTAVFVSNGPLVHFDRELTAEDLKPFEQYRADRILVLVPQSSMDRARQLWNTFKGSASNELGGSRGKVYSGDLPALFVIKTILDLKLIETGWWRDVSIRIDAGEGSDLQIDGSDEKRAQVLDWIKKLIAAPLPDPYFAQVREVAIHRFDSVRLDLQALTWERDPMAAVQGPETTSARLVQDVAQRYF